MSDIASVSLERPLERIRRRARPVSFEEYGFAVDPRPRRPAGADRARRGARRRRSSRCPRRSSGLQDRRRRRRARLHPVRHREGQGRRGPRPQGILARRPRAARRRIRSGSSWRPTSGRAKCEGFRETFEELYAALEKARRAHAARDRAAPRAAARISSMPRSRTATRCCACCIIRRSTEAAEGEIRAAAHEDINTITLLLGAEEAGLQLLQRQGRVAAGRRPAGRAGGQHRRHARAADQPAGCARPRTGWSTRRARRRAGRAIRCRSSCTSGPTSISSRSTVASTLRGPTITRRRSRATSSSSSGCARSTWPDSRTVPGPTRARESFSNAVALQQQ